MKKILIIFTVFISVMSYGQNTENDEPSKTENTSKIRLSPFFSYDFNNSSKTVRNDFGVYNFSYNDFNYKVGIDVEYKITKKISLSTGLNYSSKDFSFFYDCPSCGPLGYDTQTKFRFLEIPVTAIYIHEINRLELFGQFGIVNQFSPSFGLFDDNYSPAKIKEYSISGKIGLGMSYPILNKHRLFFVADFTRGLTSIFEEIDYKYKSFGLRIGMQFLL